jgi:hypothetical protein
MRNLYSLILGAALGAGSVFLYSLYPPVGLVLSIIGLILCIIQIKNEKTGLATAGLVLNIIGIILSIVMAVAIVVVWQIVKNTLVSSSNNIDDIANNLPK